MGYTNSPLVDYTKLSPNNSGLRTHSIDRITPHCVVGQCSVERLGEIFAPKSRQASSNYGIGYDGKVGMYCEEKNRSWCSSSNANDQRAVTIECASDTTEPYAFRDVVFDKLVELCADICKRNGKTKLLWLGTKEKALNYVPKPDEMILTAHRWFASTCCLPIDTELLTRNGWVKLSDIEIGDEVAAPDLNNLNITFEEVYDKIPIKDQDTYTCSELTATKDHRMVYTTQSNQEYRIDFYNKVLEKASTQNIYIPLAGHSNFDGLPFTEEMEAFLIAVQADGHYMYEKNTQGEKRYYGLEFRFRKERKIERLKGILEALHFPYKETHQSDGTVKIRIYNYDSINIVNDICEKYLQGKCFTWEWINMSPSQAELFLSEIMEWDGCYSGNKYSSRKPINLEIVNAIAALNNVGSRVTGTDVYFRETPYITLGTEAKRNGRKGSPNKTKVSCVSVKTGLILIRQNGKTFIVGNCPGTWMYAREGLLAERVNKLLNDKPDLIVNGVDYSNVYNYEYYMEKYEDLREVFKGNQKGAFNHFLNFGMNEGRQAKVDFDVDIYAYNYTDLQKVYGVNLPRYYEHFCKFGKEEGRVADKYIRPISIYKGVDYSLVYDGKYYYDKYEDLRKAYGENYGRLIEHFVKFGMVEGRQASKDFNVHVYKDNYKDLRNVYGEDLPRYYMHYINFGYNEHRNATTKIR